MRKQAAASVNPIPKMIQQRDQARKRLDRALAKQRSQTETLPQSQMDKLVVLQGAAVITFVRRPWSGSVREHLNLPSKIRQAFADNAEDLTKAMRTNNITVFFANGDYDPDLGATGFKLQLDTGSKKIGAEQRAEITAARDKIGAQLKPISESVSSMIQGFGGAKRPLGLDVNMYTSHVDKTL